MKNRSKKQIKNTLTKLETKYNFRKPYQILIDHKFLKQIDKQKKTIKDFERIFKSTPKFLIPKCLYEPGIFSKHVEIRNCKDHNSSLECIKYILKGKNVNHYFVAFRDLEVIEYLKSCKNVPILFIYNSKIMINIKHFDND